jgi:uncharacterized protein (TIGR03000 family)
MARSFSSPPLTGDGGTYTVRVRWTQGGRTVEQTRTIRVEAGQRISVDFAAPEVDGGQMPYTPDD